MRTRSRPVALLLLVACLVSACATSRPDVYGRTVTVVPTGYEAKKVKGELLAVDQGRIWVYTKDGVRDFATGSVQEVRVQRHGLGGGVTRRIGLIGGLVSAIALTASCSSVEGNGAAGCAAVGGAIGGLFALTGTLSSLSLDGSAQARVAPQDAKLRGYARFPAGPPKGMPPEWLSEPPATTGRP